MRLIYDNRADSATISASSTSGNLVASNLANNAPELVWRATNKQPTITLTWAAAQSVEAVAIAWTNLTAAATVTFRVFTGTSDVTPAQTATVTAGSAGVGCVYSTFFPAGTTGKKVQVYISDTTNSANVQVGRVIAGPALRPARGVRPGAGLSVSDRSNVSRTESGTLRVEQAGTYRTLSVQFDMVDPAEANAYLTLMRGGAGRVVFATVFPDPLHPHHHSHGLLGRPVSGYEQTLVDLGLSSGTLTFEEIVSS